MKPTLIFQKKIFTVSDLGMESSIPDLIPGSNVQNKTRFYLDEEDEIYEGYGKRFTSYPYRQYTCYNRRLYQREMKTATLENDHLKAVFLPELGGRLWVLWDKQAGKNLLYTNDVIRPSNLAIRNAWVSGGVEWNIGMIGHTPFTMEQLYTARLEAENGTPVLRMYEYERVRKVTYQMDFWLGEADKFLNCRMRIFNQTEQVVPMYWWSNIAVPEYEEGRVIVPAGEAYTNRADGVYKVPIPMVDGVDISKYKNIPRQVDYFFNIPKDDLKYIANVDGSGYGLLHMSTRRLQSRKLFSWGNNEASGNWQKFLTEDAGRYVEIQAGLGKTQYGCIPMAPHTAWEWLELYGPVQTSGEAVCGAYSRAEAELTALVREYHDRIKPEEVLVSTKPLARKKGTLLCSGNSYAAFENTLRAYQGNPVLSEHLEFVSDGKYRGWEEFLKTGRFPRPSREEEPEDFVSDDTLYQLLSDTIESQNRENWYAHYQLGLCLLERNETEKARREFAYSNQLEENPWALHGLAVVELKEKNPEKAAEAVLSGYHYRKKDLSYLKETWKILLLCKAYDKMLEVYAELPEELAGESRIYFGYLMALARTGREKEVLKILEKETLVLEDLRECEDTLGALWSEVCEKVHGMAERVPAKYNYDAL